ncbi:PREDICTED: putative F-box protein At2g33200 [Camelina sativa]|uniref:F-box protein At2g33200 n=1 Tax=Camelina sativa TaxID=90675 RepID=A0ABM0ZB60_CAMSA|nr:PREDICTED: putative F-box protein At2g33200 [Camelina sativa]
MTSPGDVDWSEMCPDAMQLIIESLSCSDFHRARTVCSKWYSVSKSCVAGLWNRYPWLILFRESSVSKPPTKLFTKFSDTNSCKLFDLREGKIYRKRCLGDKLSESRCLASYGNWILMMNPSLDFYVLNVFTCERIDLPSLSLPGEVRFPRKDDARFLEQSWSCLDREMAVLWIDEKTKHFVVSLICDDKYLFSYKKGDDSWWRLEGTECLAMAHKDQKLCVYTSDHLIKILDYSGDIPVEIIEENPYLNHPFYYDPKPWEYIWKRRLAITTSGDVLIILSLKGVLEYQEKILFYIFKMNLQGKEWERVDSLGNEILVFGDGITLAVASGKEEIRGGVIYFAPDDVWPQANFPSSPGVFDLATTKIRWSPPRLIYRPPSIRFRWIVPRI